MSSDLVVHESCRYIVWLSSLKLPGLVLKEQLQSSTKHDIDQTLIFFRPFLTFYSLDVSLGLNSSNQVSLSVNIQILMLI